MQSQHRHIHDYIANVTSMVVIFTMKLHRHTAALTHWGRVTHICVSKLTIIGSDNGLSPSRRQAIIWTNDGILLIRTLGTNFSQNLSEIHSFSFKKMHLKMSSAKWCLLRLGLNELIRAAQAGICMWTSMMHVLSLTPGAHITDMD